jgi:hypothetical protein
MLTRQLPRLLPALAGVCLIILAGCQTTPAGISLEDLSGWMTVEPNPVSVGQDCTRSSFIFNHHDADTAYVDSVRIDTLVFAFPFRVLPRDTHPAVREMNLRYAAAGTCVHALTYYTTLGDLTCPPCTVTVQ